MSLIFVERHKPGLFLSMEQFLDYSKLWRQFLVNTNYRHVFFPSNCMGNLHLLFPIAYHFDPIIKHCSYEEIHIYCEVFSALHKYRSLPAWSSLQSCSCKDYLTLNMLGPCSIPAYLLIQVWLSRSPSN